MTAEELENELKRTELALKKAELKAKEEEGAKTWRFSAAGSIPLIVGLLTLIGTAITAFLQRATNMELERSRYRSTLLLKALEAKDTDNISKMLLFMLDTHILDDPDGSIRKAANRPEKLPVAPEYSYNADGFKFGTPKAPRKISLLVVSDTGYDMADSALIKAMRTPQVQGSYNYLIGARGEIHALVPDSLVAFHTARFNAPSLGIGVMHVPNHTAYNRQQVASLKALIARLSKKYHIAPTNINGKNHYLPGRKCDFDLVRSEVLAPPPAPAAD
jgi:hypothetical protein